jgi:hypothetical protein
MECHRTLDLLERQVTPVTPNEKSVHEEVTQQEYYVVVYTVLSLPECTSETTTTFTCRRPNGVAIEDFKARCILAATITATKEAIKRDKKYVESNIREAKLVQCLPLEVAREIFKSMK